MFKKICCCCKDDEEPQKGNESIVVVNNDDGSAIINQPTNKSANSSFKFNRSSYSQSNGFVNDAVEFDEIDLNERRGSQKSREHLQNNNPIKRPKPTAPPEETINVTGLMLDQLYEDDTNEELNRKLENNNDDHLSVDIIEEYDLDSNVITEATDAEVQQIHTPPQSLHRLTINLENETSNGLTSSELVNDPTPAPRSNISNLSTLSNASPPPLPLISPPQWSPMVEIEASPVHETTKSSFELGTDHMDACSKDHKIVDDLDSLPTTSNLEDEPCFIDEPAEFINEPPYPANNIEHIAPVNTIDRIKDMDEEPTLTEIIEPVNTVTTIDIVSPTEQNRMYGGFSTSSSETDSDEENNDFELDSLQTTDRQQPAKAEYSVLSNEETDKSNAG